MDLQIFVLYICCIELQTRYKPLQILSDKITLKRNEKQTKIKKYHKQVTMKNLRQAMPWGAISKLAKQFKVSDTQIAKILDGKVMRTDVLDAAEELILEAKRQRKEYEERRQRIIKAAEK